MEEENKVNFWENKTAIIAAMVGLLILGLALGYLLPRLFSDKAIKVNGKSISSVELEEKIKEKYSVNYLLNDIDELILNDMYQLDEEQKQEVESEVDYYLSYYQYYYGYTEQEFYEANGFANRDEFFNEIALTYKRALYYEDYLAKIVPAEDIQNYYDKNVVGDIDTKHILVLIEDAENSEKELKIANNIISELNSGKDFDEVAKKYTEDYEDIIISEELGYSKYNANLDTAYVNAMREMETGTYSKEPVQSSFGYHIIYKKDQKEKPALDEVRSEIASVLAEELDTVDENTYYKALIELREEKGLKINDNILKNTYENYCKQYTETVQESTETTENTGDVVSETITIE